MRLYRTADGQWAGTQADATRLARENSAGRWEQVEVPTDKPGLLAWLNEIQQAGNPPPPAAPEPAPFTAFAVSAAESSLATDVAFLALPLPRQLHLAALAVENARDRIKP